MFAYFSKIYICKHWIQISILLKWLEIIFDFFLQNEMYFRHVWLEFNEVQFNLFHPIHHIN